MYKQKLFVCCLCLLFAGVVNAKTRVFVQNDTGFNFVIEDTAVTGDDISKKAWKAGSKEVSAGDRKSVLMIVRSGKLNWMDPTPRFIEPGKTVIFTSVIKVDGADEGNEISLKQKLLGTGKSSKIWHSIDNGSDPIEWNNDNEVFQGLWKVNDATIIRYTYRIYKEKKKTDLEYVFSLEP